LDFMRCNDDLTAGFSLQPDRGVVLGGSVAISALQFALYCRPRTIGLIGIDISNARGPRFYESVGESAFSGIAQAEARIVDHVTLARSIAAGMDIALVNHSPVSVLLKHGFGYDDRFARARASAGSL